jgi:hypothetical protein
MNEKQAPQKLNWVDFGPVQVTHLYLLPQPKAEGDPAEWLSVAKEQARERVNGEWRGAGPVTWKWEWFGPEKNPEYNRWVPKAEAGPHADTITVIDGRVRAGKNPYLSHGKGTELTKARAKKAALAAVKAAGRTVEGDSNAQ